MKNIHVCLKIKIHGIMKGYKNKRDIEFKSLQNV